MTTILVIDDEVTILNMLKAALTKFGYHVLTAQNGFKAIRILDEIYVHLIITDVVMPDLDGTELVRLIRNTRHHYIPVIGMSGIPSMLENTNFDAALHKPFSMITLAEVVKVLISSHPKPAPYYPLSNTGSMGG